jgi:hypothetical protein
MIEANLRLTPSSSLCLVLIVTGCAGGAPSVSDADDGGGHPVDAALTRTDGSSADASASRLDGGEADAADPSNDDAGPILADASTSADAGEPAVDAAAEGDAGSTPTTRFVAVGYGGHRTVSLDGRTWEHHVIDDPAGGDDPNLLRGVGYGHGVFIAVGNRVMTSTDGITWTTTIADTGSFLSDAAWADGLWVTAGGNGLRMSSTDDGATFAHTAPYVAGHFRSIAAGNGAFVAVGHTYGNAGLSSVTRDGITWSDRTGGAAFAEVAFGAGVFVAVGDGGRVSVSSDGASWDETTLGGDRIGDVVFADGEFLAGSGSAYWSSTDGRAWTRHASFLPEAIVAHDGLYTGLTWTAPIVTSASLDGPWTTVDATMPSLTDLATSAP